MWPRAVSGFLLLSLTVPVFGATNSSVPADGGKAVYKDPTAPIEDRVNDLLKRMTVEEKASQLIQGDISGWMNMTDPLDNTLTYNATGLVEMMKYKGGSIWAGYSATYEKFVYAVNVGQRYLMENTTLGIPALVQSEGLHGFTNNGTIFPSPIGLASSFNTALVKQVGAAISNEAEGLGIQHIFAPVLDLGRELRWGRVEEGYGEDPFLTGEIGHAFVTGIQSGTRRNVSSTAKFRSAATCKHFAAFGSPHGGLNIAPVQGGERELRHYYLKPFKRACVDGEALSLMTAYSSYDGIPAIANDHLLIDILRDEWDYPYWVTTDAGSVDMLYNLHDLCDSRECAAKIALENGLSGEMGGGTYTYLTIPDQVRNGTIDIKAVDEAVKNILRVKFSLGLFENPYPYNDYANSIRTQATQDILHQMEREAIILLENRNNALPLKKGGSVALIGPSAGVVTFGDYVFHGSSDYAVSPLAGFTALLDSTGTKINYAEGCKWWSNDQSGFDAAVSAAEASDAAVVMVGTWSRDQTELWQGLNATTGEHVDVADLGLVGAQLDLVKAIKATGKKTIVVFVSGRPVAEPWVADNADAVVQQFYPGDLGGLAIAEVLFGDVNPSGKLSLSAPRNVGTTPAYYNYLKGGRPLDPGLITPNGTLIFGHQYVLNSPVPLWSFGYGLSYTTFQYSNLRLSESSGLKPSDTLTITVSVQNNGMVAGKEVVQVYLVDLVSSVVTSNQFLAGFQKTDELQPGQSVDVSIDVLIQDLAIWTTSNEWVVEPGAFELRLGSSQQVYLNTTFTVG